MKTSTTEKGLEFPMDYKRISKFEKNNPNIAVNVLFVSEKKEIESLECMQILFEELEPLYCCLLYTSPSPRDLSTSRMPSSA